MAKQAPLAQLIEEQQLKVTGIESLGFVGDYPVRLAVVNNLVQVTFTLSGDVKPYTKELKTALKGTASAVAASGDILVVSLPNNKTLGDRYRSMADIVPPILRANGVTTADTCSICNGPGSDSVASHRGAYRPVHGNCVRGLEQEAADKAQQSEVRGNYVTGLIGALLGGLIGSIPSVLAWWFFESLPWAIAALLYAIIPVFTYGGYWLLRGRMNRVALLITVVLSVGYAVLTDFILLGVSMATAGYPLARMSYYLFEQGHISDMIPNFIMSLVFIALGLLITWGLISRTARTKLGEMQVVLETMSPLPGRAFPAAAAAEPSPEPATPVLQAAPAAAPAAEPAASAPAEPAAHTMTSGKRWDNTKDPWDN